MLQRHILSLSLINQHLLVPHFFFPCSFVISLSLHSIEERELGSFSGLGFSLRECYGSLHLLTISLKPPYQQCLFKLEKRQRWGGGQSPYFPQGLRLDQLSLRKGQGLRKDGSLVGHLWSLHPSGRDFLVREDQIPECPGKMEAAEGGGKNNPSRQMVLLIS